MTAPTAEQLAAAETAEHRDGDQYHRAVGHLILPGGALIAVSQEYAAGDLANALTTEVWMVWRRHIGLT